MSGCVKFIDPNKDVLTHWLQHARLGEQCQVLTAQGEVYAHLTKLKGNTVKLPLTGFMGQANFSTHKIRFMELMEILGAFNGQS